MTADPTNSDRAQWATAAIDAFAAATHTSDESLDTKVSDLLADLHHLCDAHAVSFAECLERADAHYAAELRDDPGPAEPSELLRVVQEYLDLFNASRLEEIDRLIADACVDPLWDDRTNLLSLLADEPEDLGLVLATGPEDHIVIRHAAGSWVADASSVDWDALEDRAFAHDDAGDQ